ncbi:MAG: molybdopterin-dependent oxidoreductase [Nitrospirae bacterium]|nr:molybdopterin-dependent oxidoreductase [Nitrospirota bacterium]
MERREFLELTGTGALSLTLLHLTPSCVSPDSGKPRATGHEPRATYHSFQDLYRSKWTWDKTVRSTHFVNCWYQAHCAYDVYVKDGIVLREEQAGEYPQTHAGVPDFNPRGCQKGVCYSQRMYEPTRVKYPLKRIGERGSGRWKRISWDEALTEIADAVIDTTLQDGSDTIVWEIGPLITMGTFTAGQMKLAVHLDQVTLDMNPEIGDAHHGAAVTFGNVICERSADDWFNSDIILIWGCNPVYTQIPNVHFLNEARYKGTRIVSIAPDLNASSIHTDQWLSIRPGTDAALALGLCKTIIDENLQNADFIREQTDLPLLVREDTRRFLRDSDFKPETDRSAASEKERVGAEKFYVWDETSQSLRKAPRRRLKWGKVVPSLSGSHVVQTPAGAVRVRPVFDLLKETLRGYGAESVEKTTGIPATRITALARDIARAEAVCNVTSSNFGKYYHGNLVERSIILLLSLCGHIGRKGGGYSAFPFIYQDGIEKFLMTPYSLEGAKQILALNGAILPSAIKKRFTEDYTKEMVVYELAREGLHEKGLLTSGTLFWAIHGGVIEASGRSREWDPAMKRDLGDFLHESFKEKWQSIWPPVNKKPRVLFTYGGNIWRRLRAYTFLNKTLLPKLHKFVAIDWRMTSTTQWADIVLPAAGWYEKTEHKWVTPLTPFIHVGSKMTQFFEARSDWEICLLIAKKIRDRARERGLETFKDRWGKTRHFETAYDEVSAGGRFDEGGDDALAGLLIKKSTNLGGIEWEELKKKGFARFTSPGNGILSNGNACDIKPNETITPFTHHTEKKIPYSTATRRIQFYQDHPLYLELGEELPVQKDPPTAGGTYPLMLGGGHTRWSIHAAWRDNAYMLRLQRGVPVAYLSSTDAHHRGIRDGDEIEVRNDLNRFRIHAKVSPSLRPGQIIIYHAWENFQFKNGDGFQNLIPSPINPVELAGGQLQLRPMSAMLSPGQFDRDTRVEIRKV